MNPAIIWHWLEDQYYSLHDIKEDIVDWNERCEEIPLLVTAIVVIIGATAAIIFFGSVCAGLPVGER